MRAIWKNRGRCDSVDDAVPLNGSHQVALTSDLPARALRFTYPPQTAFHFASATARTPGRFVASADPSIASGEVLTAVLCCTKQAAMARPRGRTKTARLTVNLDDRAYSALRVVAGREDMPVSQVARRAIVDFLAREEPSFGQRSLPLTQSSDAGEPAR